MPRWKELKRFCDRDNWILYKETDHYYYRKVLPSGEVLYTKVSKGSDEIHHKLWLHIRDHQLKVTQQYFNSKI